VAHVALTDVPRHEIQVLEGIFSVFFFAPLILIPLLGGVDDELEDVDDVAAPEELLETTVSQDIVGSSNQGNLVLSISSPMLYKLM
jgi:hypothetical protein